MRTHVILPIGFSLCLLPFFAGCAGLGEKRISIPLEDATHYYTEILQRVEVYEAQNEAIYRERRKPTVDEVLTRERLRAEVRILISEAKRDTRVDESYMNVLLGVAKLLGVTL